MRLFLTILAILIDIGLVGLAIISFSIGVLFGIFASAAIAYTIILSIVILINVIGED